MTYLDAIILGLVQGLTEFIPVSSSGHLIIFSSALDLKDAFTFDVLINFGTLFALIVFYRKKIWEIICRTTKGKEWLLLAKLFAATIPAAFFGIILASQIEYLNSLVWIVIVMLVAIGIPMIVYGREKEGADDREIEKSITWARALLVGAAQAIALIPGTSRSGITILTGINLNLTAKKAAEFSFLLAIPTIAGASMVTLFSEKGIEFVSHNFGVFLVGNFASFIAGIAAISFLIKLIGRRGLKDFGWYRLGLAGVLIILVIAGII